MAYNKLLVPTAQITTGAWNTVDDASTTTQGLANQIPAFFGTVYPVYDTVNLTTLILQYVQFNPTVNTTAVIQGAAVYFKDTTRTVVTQVVTEALTYVTSQDSAIDSFAGVFGNAVAPATVGDGIWILKRGYYANFFGAASMVKGDRQVLSNAANTAPTINSWTRVAGGTALGTAEAATVYIVATASTAGSPAQVAGILLANWP